MGLYRYSHKVADEKQVARAQVHDVNASHKDLSQVLGAIRNKTVKAAEVILDEAISMKKAIPYKKFATALGHRGELGGKRGRYPVKEAKVALGLLKNAVANAESKGLDRDSLYIKAASAYKQNKMMRYRKYWASGIIIGYGRQSFASKYVTCWAEITLAEKRGKEKKTAKPADDAVAKSKPTTAKPEAKAHVEKVHPHAHVQKTEVNPVVKEETKENAKEARKKEEIKVETK